MSDTIKDLIDRRTALKGLVLHPGWKVLCASAAEHREFILQVFETPISGVDAALAQEFSKGRAYQLKQLSSAPQALIDNLTTEIQSIQQETDNARDSDATAGNDTDDASSADDGERAP